MERGRVEGSGMVVKSREKVLCSPEICIERGYLLTGSYKKTESGLPLIRKAKALAKILDNMSIHIAD